MAAENFGFMMALKYTLEASARVSPKAMDKQLTGFRFNISATEAHMTLSSPNIKETIRMAHGTATAECRTAMALTTKATSY